MELSKENQRYDRQWDIVDGFYSTNEPEGFNNAVTPDESEALRVYYFVNYQEKDVYKHRENLVSSSPDLVNKAELAARKIAALEGLSDKDIAEIFPTAP